MGAHFLIVHKKCRECLDTFQLFSNIGHLFVKAGATNHMHKGCFHESQSRGSIHHYHLLGKIHKIIKFVVRKKEDNKHTIPLYHSINIETKKTQKITRGCMGYTPLTGVFI
jgi:hypothetical protein